MRLTTQSLFLLLITIVARLSLGKNLNLYTLPQQIGGINQQSSFIGVDSDSRLAGRESYYLFFFIKAAYLQVNFFSAYADDCCQQLSFPS